MASVNPRFVQVLAILPHSDDKAVPRILLCKWLNGDFKDRYTGLWGKVLPQDLSLRDAAVRLSKDAFSYYPKITAESLELVAVLGFDVPVDNTEYIYTAVLKPEDRDASLRFLLGGNKEEHARKVYQDASPMWICEWFDIDKIPFDQMPADDKLWYPQVLQHRKLEGAFVFAGEPKYVVKSYELREVSDLVEPDLSDYS